MDLPLKLNRCNPSVSTGMACCGLDERLPAIRNRGVALEWLFLAVSRQSPTHRPYLYDAIRRAYFSSTGGNSIRSATAAAVGAAGARQPLLRPRPFR